MHLRQQLTDGLLNCLTARLPDCLTGIRQRATWRTCSTEAASGHTHIHTHTHTHRKARPCLHAYKCHFLLPLQSLHLSLVAAVLVVTAKKHFKQYTKWRRVCPFDFMRVTLCEHSMTLATKFRLFVVAFSAWFLLVRVLVL